MTFTCHSHQLADAACIQQGHTQSACDVYHWEFCCQPFDEPAILLDDCDTGLFVQQALCKAAQARANLNDRLSRSDVCCVSYFLENALALQKILPKGPGR